MLEEPNTTPAPEPSLMDTPVVETPVVETPAVEAAAVETPVAEPPADETPEQKATREAEEAKTKEAEGVPDTYADFTKPDDVELDDEVLGSLKEFAKERGMTQAQAQHIVDLGVQLQQKNQAAFTEAMVAQRTEWREASKADTEFGGAELAKSLPLAVAARENFGTPALKELLDNSGLGDHPEVIRFFYRVGKATGEHAHVNAGKTTQPVSFYDNPTSKPRD